MATNLKSGREAEVKLLQVSLLVGACVRVCVRAFSSSYKPPVMSKNTCVWGMCEGLEDDGRRKKRREKNRVAAQRSRKKQTERADKLHEACELLEQWNRKLKTEVDSLSKQQRILSEALTAHEPLCPIMHCVFSASSHLHPDNMAACSL